MCTDFFPVKNQDFDRDTPRDLNIVLANSLVKACYYG